MVNKPIRWKYIVVFGLLALWGGKRVLWPVMISGAPAGHVVISEIQIAGQNGADDEFVELYNPTSIPVSIDGWRLRKTASNLDTELNLVGELSGTIPANSYYLIAHPHYSGITAVDHYYTVTSSGIPSNGIIYLYADAGTTLVDLVGLGSAELFEGAAVAQNPPSGGSVERKAAAIATLEQMLAGGLLALEGNGEDSDHNANDFVIREKSQPQNRFMREMQGDATKRALLELTGDQETETVITDGSGKATVEINTTLNRVYYVISIKDLTGVETMAHIHGMAAPGFNAPALTPLPNGFDKQGEWQYTDDQEEGFLNGLTYINIHTYTYPDGELRGQIVFDDVVVVPTLTPTSMPTPTLTLTPSPTVTPTTMPTPTFTPTPSLTMTPAPTLTPSPTPLMTPSPNPTPTPQPASDTFYFMRLSCEIYHRHFYFFGRRIDIPFVVCWLRR